MWSPKLSRLFKLRRTTASIDLPFVFLMSGRRSSLESGEMPQEGLSLRSRLSKSASSRTASLDSRSLSSRSRSFSHVDSNSISSFDETNALCLQGSDRYAMHGRSCSPDDSYEDKQSTLYVGRLAPETTERELRSFFEYYGAVLETKVFPKPSEVYFYAFLGSHGFRNASFSLFWLHQVFKCKSC